MRVVKKEPLSSTRHFSQVNQYRARASVTACASRDVRTYRHI